jgi:Co/Zn/Cd efflux system component
MGTSCCENVCKVELNETNKSFKKILWIALILNFLMFFVEVIFGFLSHSLSLKADAIDFLGDSANYFMTLFVLNSIIQTRAKVSLLKAAFMFSFGLWILTEAIIRFTSKELPNFITMSWIGLLALVVNAFVAFLLYKFRNGDSNMQSVWLCSRNDAIGNIAVIFASAGVFYLSSKWPDLIVAIFMAALSVNSSYKVLKLASAELGLKF